MGLRLCFCSYNVKHATHQFFKYFLFKDVHLSLSKIIIVDIINKGNIKMYTFVPYYYCSIFISFSIQKKMNIKRKDN